jgi:hypothetical protein
MAVPDRTISFLMTLAFVVLGLLPRFMPVGTDELVIPYSMMVGS